MIISPTNMCALKKIYFHWSLFILFLLVIAQDWEQPNMHQGLTESSGTLWNHKK
jgi:hypothetical protein